MSSFVDRQAATWTDIRLAYEAGQLGAHETVSGPGSELAVTTPVRHWLPQLITDHAISSMLDAPCGDWHWMQHVDLTGITYTGWDIEPTTITRNTDRWPNITFECRNLLTADIPAVDLIVCRDLLIHLDNDHIKLILDKFVTSGSRWLLTTNHPTSDNTEGDTTPFAAYWQRTINVEAAPFNLAGRTAAIREPNHPVDPHTELVLFDLGQHADITS